ncbi:MAG: methyltransferase domain-containing protein [Ignavibacteriales bacterium]|nr:methyltransferase domain-containing protein [Ignavibacteriales bacterium]
MRLPRNKVVDRLRIIRNLVKDKVVLHLGFTDSPFTEKKYHDKSLFHIQLAELCKKIVGIDLDEPSIIFLKSKGIEDIYTCDIYNLQEHTELLKYKFDIILFSEVIEHLPNAGLALQKIYEFIRKTNPQTKLIITTLNVHNFIFRFTDAFLNIERVHPDHYYYFSHHTLTKLITDNGYIITDFKYVLYRTKNPFLLLLPKFLNVFSSSFMPYLFFECKIKLNKEIL